MFYEINIAKLNPSTNRYTHYFATAERSITSQSELVRVYTDLVERFPSPEFELSVRRMVRSSSNVNIEEVIAEEKAERERKENFRRERNKKSIKEIL